MRQEKPSWKRTENVYRDGHFAGNKEFVEESINRYKKDTIKCPKCGHDTGIEEGPLLMVIPN